MRHRGIAIPGFALDKNGKPQKSNKRLSVSNQIAQRKSKQVGVRRGKRAPG